MYTAQRNVHGHQLTVEQISNTRLTWLFAISLSVSLLFALVLDKHFPETNSLPLHPSLYISIFNERSIIAFNVDVIDLSKWCNFEFGFLIITRLIEIMEARSKD
ncbi:unnamed protein product [Lactuca virosa]|uniref:Uncharacterized protein n=1 Tax=Lactuca virosa TaxID=75947 RepID=A0AAU9MQM4_9ASTR|nr:unnamed protein product [Lactuca virosa]